MTDRCWLLHSGAEWRAGEVVVTAAGPGWLDVRPLTGSPASGAVAIVCTPTQRAVVGEARRIGGALRVTVADRDGIDAAAAIARAFGLAVREGGAGGRES